MNYDSLDKPCHAFHATVWSLVVTSLLDVTRPLLSAADHTHILEGKVLTVSSLLPTWVSESDVLF